MILLPISFSLLRRTPSLLYIIYQRKIGGVAVKASSAKTPQPTPVALSVPCLSSDKVLPRSSAWLATLRRDCLIRDKHRCVITRKFDETEAIHRKEKNGDDATDDEGNRFVDVDGPDTFDDVHVAHILPHSLMSLEGDGEMVTGPISASDQSVQQISQHPNKRLLPFSKCLMLACPIYYVIKGTSIDRPTNAITLTTSYHVGFGSFRTFFLLGQQSHIRTALRLTCLKSCASLHSL